MITSVPHLDSISNGEPPMLTRPSITAVVTITSLQHVGVVNLSAKFSTPCIFAFQLELIEILDILNDVTWLPGGPWSVLLSGNM